MRIVCNSYRLYVYICTAECGTQFVSGAGVASGMRQGVASTEPKDGAFLNYGYICVFLLQLFVIVLCGSYINSAIVCISWSIVFFSGHEHNVVICMLCSISIVLQTYALSVNSQHVLLVSSPPQKACETLGISGIESLYQRSNVFKSCNANLLVPFIPHKTYSLQEDPDIKLMYGEHVAAPLHTESPMHMTTCRALGLSCFRWKIRVQGFGSRLFEPCWPLVRNILVNNASQVLMIHRTVNMPTTYERNVSISHSSDMRFVHTVSTMPNPLELTETPFLDAKELSSVSQAPDSTTFFVLVPSHPARQVSMHIALSVRCASPDRGTTMTSDEAPFFHSGAVHLTAAATPSVYTVYSAFSDCSRGMGGCNSRLLTSFLVYICNVVLSLSCLVLTHSCAGLNANEYSAVHFFALGMAFVTFNWVAMVCIYFGHPASLHGGIANLSRPYQWFFYILHGVQFALLLLELVCNEVGNNTEYILARMHNEYRPEQLLLPFTLLDSNIYIENCTLYLISSIFVAYLLYFKTGA